jgi:L-ribulose-5-phosphate 3-epimerase
MDPYRLGLYEKSMPGTLDLPRKLEAAASAGFDYLELSIDESDEKLARLDWTESGIREALAAQASAGMGIKSICLSAHRRFPLGHPDPLVQARSLEIMRAAIRLSGRLGVRLIQLAGYDVFYEPSTEATRASFARNLELCVEMAAGEGVVLAFETMETEFMDTVAKAMAWVERLRSPYLQVYPDLGNVTNAALASGGEVSSDLSAGRGHLVALHLKETRPGIFREVPYGEGHVDFPSACATAFGLGVRMFVGEFWYDGGEDWEATLSKANAFLRGALSAGWARAAL